MYNMSGCAHIVSICRCQLSRSNNSTKLKSLTFILKTFYFNINICIKINIFTNIITCNYIISYYIISAFKLNYQEYRHPEKVTVFFLHNNISCNSMFKCMYVNLVQTFEV